MDERNFLEDLSTGEVLALLFLHQAARKKLFADTIDEGILSAWEAYQDLFAARLVGLDEVRRRYLLYFSHPQSSEGIDPYDEAQVDDLKRRYGGAVSALSQRLHREFLSPSPQAE